MKTEMSLYRDVPSDGTVVSPELALVDPELAARLRSVMPDLVTVGRSREQATLTWRTESAPRVGGVSSVRTSRHVDALSSAARRARSRKLQWAVGVASVAFLLFFNVRVEVGQTPASAVPQGFPEIPVVSQRPTPRGKQTPDTPPGDRNSSGVRRFAWAPAPGASGYYVEVFRDAVRVFAATTPGPALTIPKSWRHDGKSRSLRPGAYRWYVWPVTDGVRASRAVVQSRLVIP